ncbi:MAG: peptidase M13 [Actinobacteria bacterium]|nr:peptidase M13 [Actinomycetota bacterium]
MLAPVLDLRFVDPTVRPQDDLFRFVNGRWLDTATIDSDQPIAGAFITLRDNAEAAVRDIITGLAAASVDTAPVDDEARKIATLYADFMDESAVEQAGAAPLLPALEAVDTITSPTELMAQLGRWLASPIGGLFGVTTESDPGDHTRVIPFLTQAGIGLPDRAYYFDADKAEIRREYEAHIAASFCLAGWDGEAARGEAATVVALETAIAACHWDIVRTRDLREMYNLVTLDEFDASAPTLRVRTFIDASVLDETKLAELVNAQPSFFTEVSQLLESEPLEAWKTWLRWNVISSLSPYLSTGFVNERFRFYGTVLSGTPELRPRWKRGVALVEGVLGEAVGRRYVEQHFSPVAKERMDALVANLVEAYRQSIGALDWMTAETRERALDKLAKFRPKVGYPAKWKDSSSLEIIAGDLLGNVERAAAFEVVDDFDKVGKPVDPDEWLMTPQTVNAYYHPLRNEIVFPAAILQPPFFNERADDAVNYGGIGAVIGHEIGHGFDDQGSTADGDGRLLDWWTPHDREAFEALTAKLIAQYDVLEPQQTPGLRVNGALTIGENIGDLGGLAIAHQAWKIAQHGHTPDPVDGWSGGQRLFLSWAAIWRMKARDETVVQRLATDPHSPPEFRCNQVVRNIDEFHIEFGTAPGDRLWMDPADRVKIW